MSENSKIGDLNRICRDVREFKPCYLCGSGVIQISKRKMYTGTLSAHYGLKLSIPVSQQILRKLSYSYPYIHHTLTTHVEMICIRNQQHQVLIYNTAISTGSQVLTLQCFSRVIVSFS